MTKKSHQVPRRKTNAAAAHTTHYIFTAPARATAVGCPRRINRQARKGTHPHMISQRFAQFHKTKRRAQSALHLPTSRAQKPLRKGMMQITQNPYRQVKDAKLVCATTCTPPSAPPHPPKKFRRCHPYARKYAQEGAEIRLTRGS